MFTIFQVSFHICDFSIVHSKDNLLLGDADSAELCHKCGIQIAEKRRKTQNGEWTPVIRCIKRGCQTI